LETVKFYQISGLVTRAKSTDGKFHVQARAFQRRLPARCAARQCVSNLRRGRISPTVIPRPPCAERSGPRGRSKMHAAVNSMRSFLRRSSDYLSVSRFRGAFRPGN